MPTIDPKSFTNNIVPLVYIENITLSEGELTDVELDRSSYMRSQNQFGTTVYDNNGLNTSQISQNQRGLGIATSINTFLMLNKNAYDFCKATDSLEVVLVLTSDQRAINALRSGKFRNFKTITNLAARQLVTLRTVPFKQYVDFQRSKKVVIDEEEFTKLNFTTTLNSIDTNPDLLACFAFTRFSDPTILSPSLGGRKQLFGRITGEVIIDQGLVNNATYFFKVASNGSIWAGPVHQHTLDGTNKRIYMEGIKHTTDDHRVVRRNNAGLAKIIDARLINADDLMDTLEDNFIVDQQAKETTLNKKSSDTFFLEKQQQGISPTFTSMDVDGKIRNLTFVNILKILENNSPYSKILTNIDRASMQRVIRGSFIRNMTVDRVLDSKNAEDSKRIINASLAPGASTTQVTEGYNLFKLEEKLELGSVKLDTNYVLPNYILPIVTTDNKISNFSNKDIFYRMEFTFADGIEKLIKQKIRNLVLAESEVAVIQKILNTPRLLQKDGLFDIEAINNSQINLADLVGSTAPRKKNSRRINRQLSIILGSVIDTLSVMFNVPERTLQQIYGAFYQQLNLDSGNIHHYNNFITFMSYLRAFLVEKINFSTESEQAFDGGKRVRNIKSFKNNITVSYDTHTIDSNLNKETGLLYFNAISDNGSMPTINQEAFNDRSSAEITKYFIQENPKSQTKFYDRVVTNKGRDFTPTHAYINSQPNHLNPQGGITSHALSRILCTIVNHAKGSARISFRTDMENINPPDRAPTRYKTEIASSLGEYGISFDAPPQRRKKESLVSSEDVMSTENDFTTFSGSSEPLSQLFSLASSTAFSPMMAAATYLGVLSNSTPAENNSMVAKIGDLNLSNPNSLVTNNLQDDALALYPGSGIEGLELTTKALTDMMIKLPFQIKALSENENVDIQPELRELLNSNLPIISSAIFPSLMFNHFLVGRVSYLSGFSTNLGGGLGTEPIFEDINLNIINGLSSRQKILCRITPYTNANFLARSYNDLNMKVLNEYFIIQNPRGLSENNTVASPRSLTLASPRAQTDLENVFGTPALEILRQSTQRLNKEYFENIFASSLFIRQPKEVLSVDYNFGATISRDTGISPPASTTTTAEVVVTTNSQLPTRGGSY
tara:strand:- start:8022 stop:11387 length:3366 start_codon:yes stop_codon:yes gene_type:complete